MARDAGYYTSLVVLFLDNPQQSVARVAFRSIEQGGLEISGGNIKINFNESFKNAATYFFYFDHSEFIYTGITNKNISIMSFQKSILTRYLANSLLYPQKFAHYSFKNERLSSAAFDIITANLNYHI